MQHTSAGSSSHQLPPQGYAPSAGQPYPSALSTASPSSSNEPYDYNAAIDPALEDANASKAQQDGAPRDGGGTPGAG